MKDNTRLRKIRTIVNSKSMNPVYGVVLPPELMKKWLNVYVSVTESGNSIILESGAKATAINQDDLNVISKKILEVEI